MAGITLRDVGKVYPDGTRAVTNLGFVVEDGEFLVLVGPSGCGKTTALRMVAGLESITEGEVLIGDRVVNRVPPRDRDVAMVFQSYALYPHLSVRANIGFGLQLRKVPREDLNRRVEEAAATLGLTEYLERKPRNLSGGQRQRVAMGRAIVRQPQAFLMDEPLSNLDAKLRVQMRAEIGTLQRDLHVTTLYVTHDQTEAMTLGHRVAVLNRGRLLQLAPPQELYDRPLNVFVAGFIGSPAMNFLLVTVGRGADEGFVLTVGQDTLALPGALSARWPTLSTYLGHDVVVGIRPEDIHDAALTAAPAGRTLTATAELVEPLGSDLVAHLSLMATPAQGLESFSDLSRESPGRLKVEEHRASVVARFSPRSRVQVADRLLVGVDVEQLHFFDPDSGDALPSTDLPSHDMSPPTSGQLLRPATAPTPSPTTLT